MQPGNGKDVAMIGKKFQWFNNDKIRVINDDGIQKIIDI